MRPLVLLLAGTFCLTLQAQTPLGPKASADGADTRIQVDVTRVNILFTVTDKKGRFITDLKKDDFLVFEDLEKEGLGQYAGLFGKDASKKK